MTETTNDKKPTPLQMAQAINIVSGTLEAIYSSKEPLNVLIEVPFNLTSTEEEDLKPLMERLINNFCNHHRIQADGIMKDHHLETRFKELLRTGCIAPCKQPDRHLFNTSTAEVQRHLGILLLEGLLEARMRKAQRENAMLAFFLVEVNFDSPILQNGLFNAEGLIRTLPGLIDEVIQRHDLYMRWKSLTAKKNSVVIGFAETMKVTNYQVQEKSGPMVPQFASNPPNGFQPNGFRSTKN